MDLTRIITRLGKGSRLTVQEMDGNFEYLRASYKETTNPSIDWSEATTQKFNLNEDVVFSFTDAVAGQKLTLLLNQSTGNVEWPTSVKWVNDVVPVLTNDVKLDTSFVTVTGTGFNNEVYSVVQQTNGKVLVGGYFTEYNGVSAQHIVRLNLDGSLDTTFDTGTGFNLYGNVYSIVLQSDGKILVGGTFDSYDGQSIGENIVRLNSDGTLDTTFVTGTGFNNEVSSITLQSDGKILVGGSFGQYNGESVVRIVRLNTNGSLDTTFITGTGFNGSVFVITLQSNGKILAGGQFSEYNSVSIGENITRLNSDGTLDTTFVTGTGFNEPVRTITLQTDGDTFFAILVGGNFNNYNGVSTGNCIARLNSDGTLDDLFDTGTGFNNVVYKITLQTDGKILVGGIFDQYDGVLLGNESGSFTRLNYHGSLDTSFVTGTGFNGIVYTITLQSDGKILVGGDFYEYNGVSIGNSITRLSQLPNYRVINFYFNGVNYIGESINQV